MPAAYFLFNFSKHNHHSQTKKRAKNYYCTNNKNCLEHQLYSYTLNDSVHHYLEQSYLSGVQPILKYAIEIAPNVKTGKLKPIKDSKYFVIDSLKYSYAFLTPKASELLHCIGKLFQQKIQNTNLKNTKLIITSLLRTRSSSTRLRKRNRNAIRYSAHLHGTTFDITYEMFHNSIKISSTENEVLKEVLANSLFELRSKKKCWVTHELYQSCFHIVSR
jgi:hypothetical protein